MRRVVVTGMGIVSSIGNNKEEVLTSLREGKSGIEFCEEYCELGLRSHVHGAINLDLSDALDRKQLRFMGDGAAYNYIAMEEAIDDAGLAAEDISNERTRHHYGVRRTLDAESPSGDRHTAREGCQTRWPIHGAANNVEHQLRYAGDAIQDQRRQTIQSALPARPARIALAMPPNSYSGGSRTLSLPAAVKSCIGR